MRRQYRSQIVRSDVADALQTPPVLLPPVAWRNSAGQRRAVLTAEVGGELLGRWAGRHVQRRTGKRQGSGAPRALLRLLPHCRRLYPLRSIFLLTVRGDPGGDTELTPILERRRIGDLATTLHRNLLSRPGPQPGLGTGDQPISQHTRSGRGERASQASGDGKTEAATPGRCIAERAAEPPGGPRRTGHLRHFG